MPCPAQPTVNTIGIELIVANLDRSVELFVDVLGCTLISRGPAALIAGEVATIDAGNIVISLLFPAESGEGAFFSHRDPRLAQIIFGAVGDGAISDAFGSVVTAGLAVSDLPGGRFAVAPETVRGALGIEVAIVAVPVESHE